jgi:hypothetical protein
MDLELDLQLDLDTWIQELDTELDRTWDSGLWTVDTGLGRSY